MMFSTVFDPVLIYSLCFKLLLYLPLFSPTAPADATKPIEGGHRHHRCSAASAGPAGPS